MFGSYYHISRAEKRIATCSVNSQFIAERSFESNFRACRTSYPVSLRCLNLLEIINAVEVVEQLLGVIGDFQHPLVLNLVNNLAVTAFASAVYDFLVCENDFAMRTPVYVYFFFVRKSRFEKFEEYPLRPLVVIGVGGVYLTFPVKRKTQHFQLISETVYVAFGNDCGVDFMLDSVVFGRQTESVPAHREQYVVTLHTAFSSDNIHCGVGARVTDVQTVARRIRKLNKRVIFRLGIVVFCVERAVFVPIFLPFAFNGGKIIFHFTLSFQCKFTYI